MGCVLRSSLWRFVDVRERFWTCSTNAENDFIRKLSAALGKHQVDTVSLQSIPDAIPAGIAMERDVNKATAPNLERKDKTASLVMSPNTITLPPHETTANALALLLQGRFRHITILSQHDVTSVLGILDVLSLAYDTLSCLQLTCSMILTRRG